MLTGTQYLLTGRQQGLTEKVDVGVGVFCLIFFAYRMELSTGIW